MRWVAHFYGSAFRCDSLNVITRNGGGMRVKSVRDVRVELGLGAWWRVRPIGRWTIRDVMEKMAIVPLGGGAKETDGLWQLSDNEQAGY